MAATTATLRTIGVAIEEEEQLSSELKLDGTKFFVDRSIQKAPLRRQPPQPKQVETDESQLLLPWLTKGQALQLVAKFRKISPAGCVSKADFIRVFLQLSTQQETNPFVSEVWNNHLGKSAFEYAFHLFDMQKRGGIDWREFFTTLVLWGRPRVGIPIPELLASAVTSSSSPLKRKGPQTRTRLDTPSMADLIELRDALRRLSPINEQCANGFRISREQFDSLPFWFVLAEGRSPPEIHLKAVLWNMFMQQATPLEHASDSQDAQKGAPRGPKSVKVVAAAVVNEPVDHHKQNAIYFDNLPYRQLLLFLCIDPQNVRGVQKAFTMLANIDGKLTKDLIFEVFHFSAAVLGDDNSIDEYSTDHIDAVFEEVSIASGTPITDGLTFQQMCSSHTGRMMLNSAKMYFKKDIHFAD
jgi:hypothetical protein